MSGAHKGSLDPALVKAESAHSIIKVRKNGGGNFKTATDALESIKPGNTQRVVISIGPAALTFDGTAAKYGTVDSANLIVESDYFVAVNIIVSNSAPRPDGKRNGAQAVALRISGDKAAFYGCRLLGFQDPLCDDRGNHFFKNCYIEGAVVFKISISEQHVISADPVAIITAQAGKHGQDPGGYSFVHCKVTRTGGKAFLGRAWMPAAEVVFAYSSLGEAVHPEGWSDNFKPELQKDRSCVGMAFQGKKLINDPNSMNSFESWINDNVDEERTDIVEVHDLEHEENAKEVWEPKDDSYVESYINTIGVDFVSISSLQFRARWLLVPDLGSSNGGADDRSAAKRRKTNDNEDYAVDEESKRSRMNMFIAGTDTSSCTIEWAMAEMLKNPTIFARLSLGGPQDFTGSPLLLSCTSHFTERASQAEKKTRAEKIKELWAEYENNSSLEANMVKDFDKVEMILQALEYERGMPYVIDVILISWAVIMDKPNIVCLIVGSLLWAVLI
ncbi:hypothetical protein Droror1_Dr00024045 [Drosera rotundifolia]